ncbi:thiamine diphosphokinase [Sugiyamaella lignohabitans]|uniref:Thiamine diphosphokinase n=1 Tax=Sugiyamaella lignohabitans TaxID=796027 RepID=A0A167FFD0_9ASCO|nr:thiamine diphosphokinase [Sugiyamaella lignohabitans]ANB15228.1 thiamine diphosphokinase [Sugiyamaella lignohabitans]
MKIPQIITGDFDSLRDDVRDYYESLGTKIIHNPDQYSTDFMKANKSIKDHSSSSYSILALGGMGGRVDQQFHSIHQLFLSKEQGQLIYLISTESISFLLDEGKSTIITPTDLIGETCGIIPVCGETSITTQGLRWDVSDWKTSFGSQVSTSNHLISDSITIESDKPVLFTAEIRDSEQ